MLPSIVCTLEPVPGSSLFFTRYHKSVAALSFDEARESVLGRVREHRSVPRAEEVDPTRIPAAHRQMFLDTIRDVITADGEVAKDEWENLTLFEQLLRG